MIRYAFIISSLFICLTASAATITVNTTDDELNSDGDCSLREAIETANKDSVVDGCTEGDGDDTISVPAGTYTLTQTGNDEDGNQTGDLDIESNLVITGAGRDDTTIDGNNSDRIFDVDPNSIGGLTVEISGVTVQNGFDGAGDEGGGLQDNGAELTLTNCRFQNNRSTSSGGAIYNDLGAMTITNCVFSENRALSGGEGGAIYSNANAVTISGSEFRDNQSSSTAGALYLNAGADPIVIQTTTIQGNIAAGSDGGAVYIPNASSFSMTGSELRDNEAYNGGGMYLDHSGTTMIDATTFQGNLAVDGSGGAINLQSSTTGFTLTNSTLSDSLASGDGGAFHGNMSDNIVASFSKVQVMNNISGDGGGAFRFTGDGDFVVEETVISGNSADDDGGGIYMQGSGTMTATITDSAISDNMSENGGGLYLATGTITVEDSLISNNDAFDVNGGGIWSSEALTLTNVTISGNRALENGGGLYQKDQTGSDLVVINSTIANNIADSFDTSAGKGGGYYRDGTVNSTNDFKNTLLADNLDNSDAAHDCSGEITTDGSNFIEDTAGCIGDPDFNGDITGEDPLLGPLQDNGGLTFTLALGAGSSAIDAGGNGACPVDDARGKARDDGACDIGAFEVGSCGDGFLDDGEGCDDGNTTDGDGCSAGCTIEAGFECVEVPSDCSEQCGNGTVDAGEECDDGNNASGDGCAADCTTETSSGGGVCGDGVVDSGEECDDSNTTDGDGCSATCTDETTSTGTGGGCSFVGHASPAQTPWVAMLLLMATVFGVRRFVKN